MTAQRSRRTVIIRPEEFKKSLRDPEERTLFEIRLQEAREKASPVIEDLRAAGLDIAELGDLLHLDRAAYQRAVPILLRWLRSTEDRFLKQGIARMLTIKWAKPAAARPLLEEFQRTSDMDLKWTIGNALDVVADRSMFAELAEIAEDRRHGRGRQMVVYHLGRTSDPRAVDLLLNLLDDDDVVVQAVHALGDLKSTKATPYLARLLQHPFAYKEAKKALAKIEKAEHRRKQKPS